MSELFDASEDDLASEAEAVGQVQAFEEDEEEVRGLPNQFAEEQETPPPRYTSQAPEEGPLPNPPPQKIGPLPTMKPKNKVKF